MKIKLASYFSSIIVIAIIFGIGILSFLNNTNPLVYALDNYNYSTVENNTRLFLESLQKNPGPPLYTLTPSEARNVLSGLQSGQIEKLPAEIENKTIPVGPAGEIFIQIVKPQGTGNETLPVIMYFHGGGWVLGGFDTHERLLRDLAIMVHMQQSYLSTILALLKQNIHYL